MLFTGKKPYCKHPMDQNRCTFAYSHSIRFNSIWKLYGYENHHIFVSILNEMVFFCSSDSMGTTSHMNFCFILVNSCISNIIQCISNGSKPNYTHSSVQVFDQNIISLHCHREHNQLIETNYQLINKTVDVPMALTISFYALLLFAFFSSFP